MMLFGRGLVEATWRELLVAAGSDKTKTQAEADRRPMRRRR